MTATCASSARLASSRLLGPRLRHCRNPLRDTCSTLHSRAIGCQPACASIQAYFTVTPWQSTPPLFLGFRCPLLPRPTRVAIDPPRPQALSPIAVSPTHLASIQACPHVQALPN